MVCYYSRPRIASAIAEDCYILVVLFVNFFFVHKIFDVPGPRNFAAQQ